MQTTLTAKQGAMGRVCASRTGKEQPGNKNTDGCWQHCLPAASWDTATVHTAVNSTTPVCVMITDMKGKHTAGTVNGMAGIWDNFFPRIWLEGGMAQFSQDCFSLLLSHHCKLQIHALLRHGERSSTNSSSTLQFSSFSRFIQIEHYFVSKLLRVLCTSKLEKSFWTRWVFVLMRTLKCKPITGLWFLPLCEAEAVLQGCLTVLPVFCSSEHLPDKWCWKESAPWKPPETPSFEFQVFKEPRDPHQKNPRIFLIIHHLQHSPELLLHVHWPAARTQMSCDSTGFSSGSDTDFIGQS